MQQRSKTETNRGFHIKKPEILASSRHLAIRPLEKKCAVAGAFSCMCLHA